MAMYRPFIHDTNHVFVAEEVRKLSARLSQEERELFGVDTSAIDWERYWLDVQFPGLAKWSFPLFRGEAAPLDPAAMEVRLE